MPDLPALSNTNSNNILMIKFFPALAIAAATALPAGATPVQREIVAPDELMVLVPHLEFVGYSRISTVEFCAEMLGVNDWTDMMTDLELDGMHVCLLEQT